jgi:putative tryptophan/tyrosine transport system substrate-binding protein
MPVDVIVAFGGAERELDATSTIPVVGHLTYTAEQVGAAPAWKRSANLTGVSVEAHPLLAQKRLELLKEAAGVKRVARLYLGPPLRFGAVSEMLPEYTAASRALGIEVFPVWAANPDEVRTALAEVARRGGAGVMLGAYRGSLPGMAPLWAAIVEELTRHRLPSVSDVPQAADEGAMIGFGEDIPKRSRRLAYFVDRILRGAKPADLPIEQPLTFELVVNVKAAESVGVRIPAAVMLRADRVVGN